MGETLDKDGISLFSNISTISLQQLFIEFIERLRIRNVEDMYKYFVIMLNTGEKVWILLKTQPNIPKNLFIL